jgi:hypothetical protein
VSAGPPSMARRSEILKKEPMAPGARAQHPLGRERFNRSYRLAGY